MATTTNYNWATPDDTDLVKDGASAIRTLGSSVDTTVKNLNPGTTAGDIDYYTSATAKARIGIGTAGQVLKVNAGATAPEWATTADQTPLTTKGDLFTFDTADARLGVGANGTVLTADSAETTGLKWATPAAGGFTFTTWTPSFTNFTLGNGSYTARYGTSGKFTHFELLVTLGSTSSVSGTIQATLPTTPKNTVANTNPYVFCHLFEQGVQLLYGAAPLIASTPAVQIMAINTSGTYASQSNTSSTVPFTWGTNDVFIVYGSYEEA